MSWAQKRDEFGLDVNVTDKIDLAEEMGAPKNDARERTLEDHEIQAFWRATGKESYPGGVMLRLLFLSGCRLREIALAEWSEFSIYDGVEGIAGPVLTVPKRRMKGRDGKVGDHVVPITPLMQSVIDSIPRFAGNPKFVFSNKAGRTPMSGFGHLKERVDSLMREELPELPHWQFHDLRRTARSLLSRQGVQADIAERVLAHKVSGIRGVYDRYEFLKEKRQALEALAAIVERIINPTENVVQLPQRAAAK